MIQKIEIENFYGIKNYEVNMTVKGTPNKEELEEQIIKINNNSVALFPTFIAKNASGKTSFIKAINFAFRFLKQESFVKEIIHYVITTLEFTLFRRFRREDTGEIPLKVNYAKEIIKKLFEEVSFAGSKKSVIKLTLSKNREATIEMTEDSFFVVMNDATINLEEFLDHMFYSLENDTHDTPNQLARKLELIIKKSIEKFGYIFYENINIKTLMKANQEAAYFKDVTLKNKTSVHMLEIINEFGFDAFKTLATKIDENIKTISFDSSNKSFDIFINNSDIPISPKNLSFGTQKIIEIIYKSINLFKDGGIMLIDEIENGLHLSLIKLIVSIYSDSDINKAKAQLFITTHNPVIFEQRVIQLHNVFVSNGDSIISLKEENKNKRTENLVAMVKVKNYFNDSFWISKNLKAKSTLNNLKINIIIDALTKGVECRKK